jgi:rhamnosyl/mannosyltransferase
VAKFSVCPDWASRLSQAAARADVVHIHVPNPMAIIAALAAGVRRPTVVTYHSDHIAQRLTAALFRPVEHMFYPRVGAILATSPVYAGGSDLLRAYADRVAVLPHGIDTTPYAAPTAEDRREAARLRAAHAPDGGPLWLAAGRLIYYKGLSTALRALAKTEGTLLIIGEGPDRAALEAEAARLGVARRAVFPGKVASLVPYYLAADAFWFPSNARSEAFGLVQVEAMAAGCPVINTAIPYSGVSWVCRDGESGLTVPVDDPDALAAAARRLATEPGLRARLSAGARRRVAEDFDHRVMARRSVEVYFGVLRNRARAR